MCGNALLGTFGNGKNASAGLSALLKIYVNLIRIKRKAGEEERGMKKRGGKADGREVKTFTTKN